MLQSPGRTPRLPPIRTRQEEPLRAVVLHKQNAPVRVEEIDLDDPKAEEVRVKLVGAGVCHSDYHRVDGHSKVPYLPMVLGHEGSGIITAVGPGVTSSTEGDHVIISLTAQCGRCRSCTAGRADMCEAYQLGTGRLPDGTTRFSKDGMPLYADLGTFAEETVVAESMVVKISDSIPLDKACLIGCGVMTGVGAVLNRAKVEAGSTVAIFGCGGVGLNVVQGAALASASKIIAVDKIGFKLSKGREFGATHLVNAEKEDPVRRVIEITDGGVDYAFEVIGFPQTVRQAFESTHPGGTTVMVGVPPEEGDISVPGRALFWGRSLLGTFYGAGRPRIDFPWLLDLYLDGRLKLDELATKFRPLEEINEAFDDMNKGVAARTILTF